MYLRYTLRSVIILLRYVWGEELDNTNFTFADALNLVTNTIAETEGKEYDGIIVKILKTSNTLDSNRESTKQTHIAITGEQIDIFPYLNAAGYFDPIYEKKDDKLKSFFLLQIPVRLYRKNIENFANSNSIFDSDEQYCDVNVSVQGSRRKDQADQVQFSLIKYDSLEFRNFRELLKNDDIIVLLKYKGQFKYDLFAFKNKTSEADSLKKLNNKFYKDDKSVTVVNADLFLRIDDNKTSIPDNLTEDDLGKILKDMVDTKEGFVACAYHSFGIIYGNYIKNNNYKIESIIEKANLNLNDSKSIETEVNKGKKLRESFEDNLYGISIYKEGNQAKKIINSESRDNVGKNILLYGVPGSGKSHYINTIYCSDQDSIERVVFHPEYTYSDFIGQILPQIVDDRLNYVFTPGPFTTILKKAISCPTQKFFLVIEELNRGNAPAIFGEIFQLLDRNENGESEYSITNFDIAKELFNNPKQKIKIPSNLWILATMNTSDQNVFTLDTAFQRRWQMKHINNDISSSTTAEIKIPNSEITWETFALKVNSLIIKGNEGNSSTEDKRLGAYFASKTELNDPELFAEKVLKYLWDDAFKLDRGIFFKDNLTSFDEVLEIFKTDSLKKIVRDDIYNSMTNLDD